MNTRTMLRFLFASLAIVAITLGISLVRQPSQAAHGRNILPLQAPPFVGIASAESAFAPLDIGQQLDQEAGISAYYKSPYAITLSRVRGLYRTIETETVTYTIGSISVTNYIENFDVHVYVNTDGWILAYYLQGDPTSKIVDVKAHTVNTTKLKTVVVAVAAAAGAPFTDVTYYDFRYPNATNIILVGEDDINGDTFTIQLPSSYVYWECSWAEHGFGPPYPSHFIFDGVSHPNIIYRNGENYYGTLTASQCLPNTTHTVQTGPYGVLVITYRVL